jgi:uncharacterized protein YigE (DUF2233 family)
LLVENGIAKQLVVRRETFDRRSVVAIDREGAVSFLVVDPISLQNLATFLSTRYVTALNLDGGPSSRLYVNDHGKVTETGSHYVAINFLLIQDKE